MYNILLDAFPLLIINFSQTLLVLPLTFRNIFSFDNMMNYIKIFSNVL